MTNLDIRIQRFLRFSCGRGFSRWAEAPDITGTSMARQGTFTEFSGKFFVYFLD